jgi:hypothetical protein
MPTSTFFAAASAALATKLAERRRARFTRALALAASVVIAIGVVTWVGTRPPVNLQVATTRAPGGSGPVARDRPAVVATARAGRAGDAGQLAADQCDSAAAVRMTNGLSLRIDAGSEVAFETPLRLRLRQGAVYVDSRAGERRDVALPSSIEIVTPLASVR